MSQVRETLRMWELDLELKSNSRILRVSLPNDFADFLNKLQFRSKS
jgi:hypothetical protein